MKVENKFSWELIARLLCTGWYGSVLCLKNGAWYNLWVKSYLPTAVILVAQQQLVTEGGRYLYKKVNQNKYQKVLYFEFFSVPPNQFQDQYLNGLKNVEF